MKTDFDDGMEQQEPDLDEFSGGEALDDPGGDDIAAWMDEAPEIEDFPADTAEDLPGGADALSGGEMDIAALMDDADAPAENVCETAETDEELPEAAEEPAAPETAEELVETEELPAETEEIGIVPEVLEEPEKLPETAEELAEAEELPAEAEETGTVPEILEEPEELPEAAEEPIVPETAEELPATEELPAEAEEAGTVPEILEEPEELPEAAEEPIVPETAEELPATEELPAEVEEAGTVPEVLEEEPEELIEEGLEAEDQMPPGPPALTPGQQEILQEWIEDEDQDDTADDTWDAPSEPENADTGEEESGDEISAEADAAEVEQPDSTGDGGGLAVLPPEEDGDVPEETEVQEAPPPPDTEQIPQPEEGLPLDAVSEVRPGPAPGTGGPAAPSGGEPDQADGLDVLPEGETGGGEGSADVSPLEQMSAYMAEHNYGQEDFAEYSRDPEWQRLNEALQQDPDMPPAVSPAAQGTDDLDTAVQPEPAEVLDPMPPASEGEAAELAETEELPPTASGYYEQGINDFGYEGTCGPTSIANGINHLLGTNAFTENDVLAEAIEEGLCYQDADSPADSGGTTTDQFMELYEHMNELSGGGLEIERFDFDDVLSMEQVAEQLEEGCTVHVAVDADTLWGRSSADMMGAPEIEKATDHWITVTGVERGENNEITGFHIIDSGGGVDYVDADTYQTMCYGSEKLHLTDPTCIIVSRRDADLPGEADVPAPEGGAEDLPGDTAAPADTAEDLSAGGTPAPDLRQSSTFFAQMDPEDLTASQAAMERLSGEEREIYLQALREEPAVTADIQAVAQAAGGSAAGLEYRIKTPVSLEEKLHGRETVTDIHDVSDILRYTQTFSPDDLAEGTNASLSLYEERGYTVCSVRNTWEDDANPYNGINVKLISPSGQKLEVQFHTPESFAVKDGPMHQLYEAWRQLPEDSEEARDLQNRMFALSRQLKVPRNISEVRER